MYDIAIVGGGPSGATLARLIGKKYKVLLLEKRQFERKEYVKEKCCGGLIAPDAQLMLAKFGLGLPRSALISPQLFAVRTIDMDNQLERYYQRHYINVDREEFDRWLESCIPSAVNIINSCIFKAYELKDNYTVVRYRHKDRDYEEKARLLVAADGAFSGIRKQGFGNEPSPDRYISIQEWFETGKNFDYYGAIFDKDITDFYSWTIPKDDCLILGSALRLDGNPKQRFELLKEKLIKYGFEFKKGIRRNGAHILRPTGTKQICTGNDYIALVGEAAGFISPSSAEGFSYAFESSLALAKALEKGIDRYQELYRCNTGPLKRNILLKNLKSPAMYNEKIRNIIMRSGLMSIEPIGKELE